MNETMALGAPAASASLHRLCRLVRALAVFGGLALLGVPLWLWSSAERVRLIWPQMPGVAGTPLALDERAMALGAAATVLPVAVGLYALWQLWRLFGEYGEGRVFSRPAQRHLRGFALSVLAGALVAPLTRMLIILALTLGNPRGQRLLVINLSWEDYLVLLFGAVLLAIATVMAEAVRVAEDHAGFV